MSTIKSTRQSALAPVQLRVRPLTFAVGLLASLLLALPAPAHAANHQLSGTAFFNPSPGTPCPAPPWPTTAIPPS